MKCGQGGENKYLHSLKSGGDFGYFAVNFRKTQAIFFLPQS
jgi:hypothetical protein